MYGNFTSSAYTTHLNQGSLFFRNKRKRKARERENQLTKVYLEKVEIVVYSTSSSSSSSSSISSSSSSSSSTRCSKKGRWTPRLHSSWSMSLLYLSNDKPTIQTLNKLEAVSPVDWDDWSIPLLMSKRKIRISNTGGWRRDVIVCRQRHCNRVAVEKKFNTNWSSENAEFTSYVVYLH